MPRSLHPGTVVTRGLVVDPLKAGAGLTITTRPIVSSARCPGCDQPSSRVHIRYTRTLSQWPARRARTRAPDYPDRGRRGPNRPAVGGTQRGMGADLGQRINTSRDSVLGVPRTAAIPASKARLSGIADHAHDSRCRRRGAQAAFSRTPGWEKMNSRL